MHVNQRLLRQAPFALMQASVKTSSPLPGCRVDTSRTHADAGIQGKGRTITIAVTFEQILSAIIRTSNG